MLNTEKVYLVKSKKLDFSITETHRSSLRPTPKYKQIKVDIE